MSTHAELMEQSAEIIRQSRLMRAESVRRRAGGAPGARRTGFHLLAVAEHLIDAHRLAKLDGDGATIDAIQDALVFVGRRLAKETGSDGRSARTILGHWRAEPDGGADRDGPLSR